MMRKGYDPAEAHERAQEWMAAALALLERGIEAIVDGDSFRAYLTTMSRFHTYSARNVALIHAQRPTATRVAGYRAWQALGRQVRKGETGLRIIAPYRRTLSENDERNEAGDAGEGGALVAGFGVASVFDLAQTDGEPLPAPPAPRTWPAGRAAPGGCGPTLIAHSERGARDWLDCYDIPFRATRPRRWSEAAILARLAALGEQPRKVPEVAPELPSPLPRRGRAAGHRETIAELRRRAEEAEGERDALRARLETARAAPAAPEAPTVLIVEPTATRKNPRRGAASCGVSGYLSAWPARGACPAATPRRDARSPTKC